VTFHELQRIRIPAPGRVEPYPEWNVPKPTLPGGVVVQVNAYHDEAGNVLERWLLSETDERWYRLERYSDRWVAVKVAQRVPVGHGK
jgi:hypothetical protein